MICLTCRLAIPDQLKAKAGYALRELCHRVGFGIRILESGSADILYSTDPHAAGTIVLYCNPEVYLPATICRLHERNGVQIWEQSELGLLQPLDFIGGTYRALTMMDEAQVSPEERDRLGRFPISALPSERRASAAVPLVELHAEALGKEIRHRWPEVFEQAAYRWPGRKRYAVVVSHDCDHVHIGAPMELATNLVKAALRRSRVHAGLVRLGARYIFRGSQNPFFQFSTWQEWESKRGLRSVFYVPVRPRGVAFDFNDCKSTMAASVADWDQLQRMAATGWEFGLHAAIRTKEEPWAFRAAREWLEERLHQRVWGVRHHYFALDWLQPHQCHRLHAEAGFNYDSSIAFHDAAGFRSGTCLPHAAFDPVEDRELSFRVLPCNLMDGHILEMNREVGRAMAKAREVIAAVRNFGGALVLNWHQEAAFNQLNYAGWFDALNEVMTTILRDAPWTTTAEEMCSYWARRGRELDASHDMHAANIVAQRERNSDSLKARGSLLERAR